MGTRADFRYFCAAENIQSNSSYLCIKQRETAIYVLSLLKMKELKPYLRPNCRFIEVRTEHPYCGVELSARGATVTPNPGGGEVEDFDATPFREGIWDDDLCAGEAENIWG